MKNNAKSAYDDMQMQIIDYSKNYAEKHLKTIIQIIEDNPKLTLDTPTMDLVSKVLTEYERIIWESVSYYKKNLEDSPDTGINLT